MAEAVEQYSHENGRQRYIIAESDLNDVRIIKSRSEGGYGMDCQWSDDFHHALHAILTGEDKGYYADFNKLDQLVKAIREGFVYSWDYSVYRLRMHGSSSTGLPAERFMIFVQNHDQVGNRPFGERLSSLLSFEALKLSAGLLLTLPYIPLLFMGEEYAEDNPFLYFVSHSDKKLNNAVRRGRKHEFRSFGWKEESPDPQSEETFERSRPDFEKSKEGRHRAMLEYYKTLISLRKNNPVLSYPDKTSCRVWREEGRLVLCMLRVKEARHIFIVANLALTNNNYTIPDEIRGANLFLDSYDKLWYGSDSQISGQVKAGDKIILSPYHFLIFGDEA